MIGGRCQSTKARFAQNTVREVKTLDGKNIFD